MSTSSATFRLTCMSFEAWRILKRRGCRGWEILPKRKRTCNSRGPKIPTVGDAVWLLVVLALGRALTEECVVFCCFSSWLQRPPRPTRY